MRKLLCVTGSLAIAAMVFGGGAAFAQTLTITPNPILFSISGPGQTGQNTYSVQATNGGVITSIFVSPINTNSGGNWLTGPGGTLNTNTFTLNVVNTTSLVPNSTYVGSVGVTATTTNPIATISTTFPVTLQIGNTPGQTGGSNALVPNPSTITFSENQAGQASPSSQTVSVTLNGVPVPINTVSFATIPLTTPTFVNTQVMPNGTVVLTPNAVITTPGTYQATLSLFTGSGSVQVPVTLCFGACAITGPGNGLTATPNPVNFQAQTGGSAPPQSVAVNYNGAATAINSVAASTNTGGNWLLPSSGIPGIVSVGVNTTGLTAGTYTGTVFVSTPQGQITFQVNLTLGGAPTLIATPQSLNFAYQLGTNNPLPQTIAVSSNGTAVSFSVFATTNNGGAQWLVVSPSGQGATPATLTVNVQPSGLPAGITYTGNIQINAFGGATNSTINIPVSLLVSNNPILITSPNSLVFTAQAGGSPASQTLQITSSSTPLSYTLNSTVATPPGGSWLQVPTQSGTTAGTLVIAVNTAGLAAGAYTGSITITAPNSANGSVQIPITLTITAGSALQLSPATLLFAYEIGQNQPPNQSVTVSSATGVLGFTVGAQTNNQQSWLSVTPTQGTAPGNFVVSVNATGLLAGTYTGTITVTPSGNTTTPQPIPVTLVVSNTALLVASPYVVSFNVPQGATTSSFQSVSVTSTDSTAIAFNVASTTNSVSNWLLVSASTGATPTVLTISANPSGLAPGTYSGTVTLTATNPANVTNSPVAIAVTLVVASTATLTVSQSNLTFAQSVGGPSPNPQTLSVTGVGGSITFAATVTLNQGVNWLSVSPNNATTPASLTVTANGASLLPGVYTGQITLSSPGAAAPQNVQVSLTVSNAPTITVSPTTLAPVNFQIGTANPQPQTISLSVTGGTPATFSATPTTTNGGTWLSVTPLSGTTPSNLTVTLSPAGLVAGTYNGAISISIANATNSPVSVPITLTVAPAAVITPSVVAIQNAASSAPSSIAPGMNITIYGSNMGPANLATSQLAANGTIATTVSGTQVTFDGIAAPLIYTKSTQVSVMVPYELTGRAVTSMVVTYNGTPSTALSLRVVDSSPGIYTINQMGSGQGAIYNQNGTVNGPQNPEAAGNIVQIYATGEGQTTPAGVDGMINPNRLPLPIPALPVTVLIGGIQVPASGITYAGEVPGVVSGVLQVNATIPLAVPSGPASVVITVGGVSSQANVTLSVK